MQANRYENRIVTLPNALSLLRILMIPVFVWLYCAKKAYHWSAAVVVATGLTDVLDGILARKLHMESNVGRVLDPLADKLAQAALCIVMMLSLIHIFVAAERLFDLFHNGARRAMAAEQRRSAADQHQKLNHAQPAEQHPGQQHQHDRRRAPAPGGAARLETPVNRGPVSYTHLDVYKRQDRRLCRFASVGARLRAVPRDQGALRPRLVDGLAG